MFGMSKKITPSSLVSSSTAIKGKVHSDDEIYVDGRIDGDVTAKILIVGINGYIKSDRIEVEKAVIYGSIDGNISAASVYLGQTARINGNILHGDISVENGAYINGDLKQRRD